MGELLVVLGRMSGQAAIVILVVIAIRKLFELLHVEKKYMMLLWLLPFFCLICPWKISVPHGFWQSAPVETAYERNSYGNDLGNDASKENEGSETIEIKYEVIAPNFNNTEQTSIKTVSIDLKAVFNVLGILWMLGVIALVVWNVISYIKLKNKLLCSTRHQDNVFQGAEISTPMVFGFFKPSIYIPLGLPEEYEKYVLAHENTHIRRFDVIYKLIVYSISCIHWFNPLVWLAFCLFNKDMEMSCDEETVRLLGIEEKEAYAKALLGVATNRNFRSKIIFAAPIAFEEGNVKKRIVNIVRYKKTITAIAVGAVVLCVLLAGVFISKDKTEAAENPVVSIDDINREAFNAYMDFINQVEAAIRDDFQSVSPKELRISQAFDGGIDLNTYNIGYQIFDTNGDGIHELMFVAYEKLGSDKLLYDTYSYVDGKIGHFSSDATGEFTVSGGEFFKFNVPQENKEPVATEEPVTETSTTEETIRIVDRQVVDMDSSEVATAFDAYKAVLKSKIKFVDDSNGKEILLKDWVTEFNNEKCDFTSFAIIDLDRDEVPEVVMAHQIVPDISSDRVIADSEEIVNAGYMILRYYNGKVYSYYKNSKAFEELKVDGTFLFYGGESNYGVCRISFKENEDVMEYIDYMESYLDEYPLEHTNYYVDNYSTTAERFNKRIEYQEAKPDVTWYTFSDGNVDDCFKIVKDEEEQSIAAYGKVLWDLYQTGKLPDGRLLDYSSEWVTENSFAIIDVDNDGRKELIVNWDAAGTVMTSRIESVYEYRNNVIHLELTGTPDKKYYDNGIVVEDSSHNQGRGDIIWPYALHSYDSEKDEYFAVAYVDSWSRTRSNASGFPNDIDKDGDGHVYDIISSDNYTGQYKRENLVDGAEYEEWLDSYLKGAEEISIPYQPLTEENIKALDAPKIYVEPRIYKG